ncbi:ferredoxin [Candidatus Micrarchaeota archaeon CG10_big_fil_rev_8_21_14_0_10_59_7]|nr:MAG: ferredoxin [Candidatus Micrarchaeota archaeon CG10_big_fil_rev_8_21_14_0_10_59_7]
MTHKVDKSKCFYCGGCVSLCPVTALTLVETNVVCDESKCTKCGICVKGCPCRAIKVE